MSEFDVFADRNATFAATFDQGDLPIKPRFGTIILTCVDARVDPVYFIGLELGDALVMRTVGGRATDTALKEVAILWQLMKLGAGGIDPSLGLAIVHHTDCGMAKFAVPAVAEAITEVFGTSDVVDTYAIPDERASVAEDVRRALASSHTPPGLEVSGHVYDIATGALTSVASPVTAS